MDADLLTIKEYSHYVNLKNNTHALLDKIYKVHYAPRHVIGSCSNLFKKYNPTSYQDFFDKYTNDVTNNFDKGHGRSVERIFEIATEYKKKADELYKDNQLISQLTVIDYYDLMVLHIIIETFDGQSIERDLRNFYKGKGFEVVLPTDNEDAIFGIDFMVNGPQIRHFIQVKPRTFATSMSSTAEDRKNHFYKEQKIKEKYGNNATLEFIFYEKNQDGPGFQAYINSKTNKMRFRLNDICDNEGVALYQSKREFQINFNRVSLKNI